MSVNPFFDLNKSLEYPVAVYLNDGIDTLKFHFSTDEYKLERRPVLNRQTSVYGRQRSINFLKLCGDLVKGVANVIIHIAGIFIGLIAFRQNQPNLTQNGCLGLAKYYGFSVIRDLQGLVGTSIAFVARKKGLEIYYDSIVQKQCYAQLV